MKPYLITFLTLLFIVPTFGQLFPDKEKDRIFNPDRYAFYPVALDSVHPQTIMLKGIGHIVFVNALPDSFVLGYMKKGFLSAFKKIRFASPGLSELTNFCNLIVKWDTIAPSADLILVIKELWLNEEETDFNPDEKIKDLKRGTYLTSHIKFRFESYLAKSGRYYPVCRFDTLLEKTLPLKNNTPSYLSDVMVLGLEKVARYDLVEIPNKKQAVTMESIEKYNASRFELPIFKDTTCPDGVFMSFNEFKNNKPSITEYEVKRGKFGDEMYLKSESGQWVVNRSVWGYADGKNYYIKSGDNYFRLYRMQGSFFINGSRGITRYNVNEYSYKKRQIAYTNYLSPYKLNMEDGTIY